MLKRKKLGLTALIVLMVFFTCPVVFGHSLWINATTHAPAFYPKFGAEMKSYVGYGHKYPVDDFLPLSHVAEYILVSPDGKKTAVTPANPSGFLASSLRFKEEGHYIVAMATKPGFYTMYRDGDAIHHKLGPKTGLKEVVLSNYYEQYAKSLITVGDGKGNGFAKPLGHRLEIVPMENPQTLKGDGGHALTVKILFGGQPASFCKVYGTYSGFSTEDDFACATTADKDGIARIRLSHWGPWLIKANLKMPPTDEMKEKCNEMNYTATLTIGIP
jgi:uncharacterized GH25 family protein